MAEPGTDGDLPSFCRELGLPGLADVHVHFMPSWLMQRIWVHFDRAGETVGVQWPVRYRWSDDDRVAYLRQLGVHLFTALAYAHRPALAADLNSWALDFARRTPGCVPSATFYPEPGVVDYVAHAVDAGAQVFKVHPQVGRFAADDPELEPVWGLLADAAVPVVIHAGHAPVGSEYTGPEPVRSVLSRHPRLTLVVAHLGMPDYAAFLELAERYERVALDTTLVCTPYAEREAPFPERLLPRLRDLGLAGKVLLGSDFPNIAWPYAAQVAGLVRLGLGDAWLRAVCWQNGVTLFGPP